MPTGPSVSVIVPVWNVEPYLRECLDSVLSQTIGLDRIELIAVNDGSTDGSGRVLDEWATRRPQITVIHEPNSGGPGRPRNVGLDHATGEYVFFLDADDYLGVEALERLVGMAERNASDIVLGKIVGVGGRKVYRERGPFRRNVDRADLGLVYRSGNVLKLFRRSLIERTGLRFREGIPGGEDGDFMARLYPEAATISVVADYACYFARRRPGSQTRGKDRGDDLGEYIARVETERIEVVATHRRAGRGRDALMIRHVKKIAAKFGRRWRSLGPEDRRRVFDIGAAVIRRWHTVRIQRALPAWAALRVYCLQHGLLAELEDVAACAAGVAFRNPILERDRIFARYPHFRDGSGIPDSCFDITEEVAQEQDVRRAAIVRGRLELSGDAYLTLVGGATTVELRRWPWGATWRFAVTPVATPKLRDKLTSYPAAGFNAAIELSTAAAGRPLPPGAWSIHLSVRTDGIHRTRPIRVRHQAPHGWDIGRLGASVKRSALYIAPAGDLRLRIGPPRRVFTLLERGDAVVTRLLDLLNVAFRSTRAGLSGPRSAGSVRA